MPTLSVIICTWNRAHLLDECLMHMSQTLDQSGVHWELIVVDNNSTDKTESVIASYMTRLPLKYVFEPTQGLSHARNRGLKEASGDLLIFTDDDVLVDAHWLKAYAALNHALPKDVAFVGGTIVPKFPPGADPEVIECHPQVAAGFCGVCVESVREIRTARDNLPRGANFGLVSERLGDLLFDTAFGVSGKSLIGGEEEVLFERLLAEGKIGLWWPDAKVEHLVEPDRLTLRYMGRFFFDRGRTLVMREGLGFKRTLSGVPYWLLLECGHAALQAAGYGLLGARRRFLRAFVKMSFRMGSVCEFYSINAKKGSAQRERSPKC